MIKNIYSIIFLFACSTSVLADDHKGLNRGASASGLTISGVSSGGAMAIQYALAHSSSVYGLGLIAAPSWGCASGKLSHAVNNCMCEFEPIDKEAIYRNLSFVTTGNLIDKPPVNGKKPFQRAYIFHSLPDKTVKISSGNFNKEFLSHFTEEKFSTTSGSYIEISTEAGHGIVSPNGTDSCELNYSENSYVRQCNGQDNAGTLLSVLYTGNSKFKMSDRISVIGEEDLWEFNQQQHIDSIKKDGDIISPDESKSNPKFLDYLTSSLIQKSTRRSNFDMAEKGYIYVPPSCRKDASSCRVHVALHGCKQDAKKFALTSGFNNWAEHYKVIVIYPAIAQSQPLPEASCSKRASNMLDLSLIEANPNGCWDWWGYLDTDGSISRRYLGKNAPQIKVIHSIVNRIIGR
jgi:hypothetical protein